MKKNIAIIMGGYSSEVDISLKSGNVVYENISKAVYNTYKVHILKEKWVVVLENGKEYPINKHDFSVIIDENKVQFDCVFNAIHGTPGENGQILAYLELLDIAHTSAPHYQMALTFNKRDALSVAKNNGVRVAKSVYLNEGDPIDSQQIIKNVGLPCFVKPNNAGSSFGISMVKKETQLKAAIQKAFKEDSEILIEEYLNGTEVTIGVFEYQGELKVLPMTEIVTDNDFFDYEAKYLGQSDEITPARISKDIENKLADLAADVYRIFNMKGISRSEYIVVNDKPYFLEMNTVPGLTAESLIPQQAEAAGISLEELFHNAIEMALKN